MAVDLIKIELGEGILGITYGVGYDGSGGTEIADVGSQLGAELSYKKIYKDIEIGRSPAPVKSPIIGEEGTFKIKMLETAINLITIALGGDPADVTTDATSEKYVFGGQKGKAIMHKLVYTVPQVDAPTKDDILTIYRARVEDLSPIVFSKSDERVYEVTFKLFAKSTTWILGDFAHEL